MLGACHGYSIGGLPIHQYPKYISWIYIMNTCRGILILEDIHFSQINIPLNRVNDVVCGHLFDQWDKAFCLGPCPIVVLLDLLGHNFENQHCLFNEHLGYFCKQLGIKINQYCFNKLEFIMILDCIVVLSGCV